MENELDVQYGFRVAYTIITFFAFAATILNTTNQSAFIGVILLFLLSVAFDYFNQQIKLGKNKKRKFLMFWTSVIGISISIGFMFLAMNFNLEPILITKYFKLVILLLPSAYIIMSVVDWVALSHPEEVAYRKKITDNIRNKEEAETFAEKADYYAGEKL